jgi:hypothetical protein
VTHECLWIGIAQVRPGVHLGVIGAAIQKHAEGAGFSVVREFCGHGIGRNFHEDPQVLHYGKGTEGPLLEPGMVFTIEPMINAGKGCDFRTARRLDHRHQGPQPLGAVGAHRRGDRDRRRSDDTLRRRSALPARDPGLAVIPAAGARSAATDMSDLRELAAASRQRLADGQKELVAAWREKRNAPPC